MHLPIAAHPALSSAPAEVSASGPSGGLSGGPSGGLSGGLSGGSSRGVPPWRTRDDQQTVQRALALTGCWHPAPDQRAAFGRLDGLIDDWRYDTAELDDRPEHRIHQTFTLSVDDAATVLTALDAVPECLLPLDDIRRTRAWRERLRLDPRPMSVETLADLSHLVSLIQEKGRRLLEPGAGNRAALRREASLAGWRDEAADAPTAARRDEVLRSLSTSLWAEPTLNRELFALREPDDGTGLALPPLELLEGFEGRPCKLALTRGRVVAPAQFAVSAAALQVEQLKSPLCDGRLPEWAAGMRSLREIELSADGAASEPTWRALFHQFGKLPRLELVTWARSMATPSRLPPGWTRQRSERRLWAKEQILESPNLRAAASSILRRGP